VCSSDLEGELVRPIAAYRDPRTHGPFARLRRELGDEAIYATTGIAFQPFNTLYQLAADAEDPMQPFERAQRMLMLPDFIAARLCGSTVCERTNASSTQLLNAKTRDWHRDFARAAGVPLRILPELVDAAATEALGMISPDIAAETGLSADTPVFAVGTHDTASAVLAAPIDPRNDLYISSGTWSLVGAELSKPVLTEGARMANMTNELGVFGTTRFLRNVAGLWLVQQLQAAFASAGRSYSWADLSTLAATVEPLRSVVDPDDPSLFTPGDMPAHVAALCRARGEPVPETDAQFVRCALDSIALATAQAARQAATLARREVRRMAIVGGGSANDLLSQLIADAAGLPVEAGPAECTAIGNALMQHAAIDGVTRASELRAIVRASAAIRRFDPDFKQSARMRDAVERLAR
jgi:rhamnulokinase